MQLRWRVALPLLLVTVAATGPACRAHQPARNPTPTELPPHVVAALADAEAAPSDAVRQRRAGTALIDTALEGRLELVPHAEAYLERALALDGHDLTAARKLSRLLNLRLMRSDYSRADRQVELFDRLRQESADPYERFVFDCFHQMATAASLRRRGRPLAALAQVRALEHRLAERIDANPDEVETAAMAGNYALAFAGRLPTGRKRRLTEVSDYFSFQQQHWDAQSVTARGVGTAPGTRSVFALWLAQAELAQGRVEAAREAYALVIEAGAGAGATVPMQQMAEVAAEHHANAEAMVGSAALLPAWPDGEQSCIACHSERTSLAGPRVPGSI